MQTVADIMTKEVITVRPETSIRELADLFNTHHFGTLPVVDAEGKLTGIVTASDLIEQGKNLHIPTVISLFDWVIPLESDKTFERELHKMTAQTAGELCSNEVFTIAPSASVSDAADSMSSHKLHALPVVEGNKLVGMVARIDIIRTMIN